LRKLIVLMLAVLTFPAAGIEHPSAHMRDIEKHRLDKPLITFGDPSREPMAFTAEHNPVTDRLIFGYLPYWNNGTTHLRYGLLTDLLYFSCGLAAEGALGDCRGWPESAPIDEAHKYGVRVHLVITGFDSATVKALIASETQKNTFFANCWNKVNDANADGLNIDFEGIGSVDTAVLADFFNDLGTYFHTRNSEMIVSAALPAVDWSNIWDIDAMTEMDYFFLMLYDYHWKGGDPGPVAPLYSGEPWNTNGICVEKSVNTYVSKNGEAIKDKLIAGYPYYGVNWASTSSDIPGTQTADGVSVLFDSVMSEYAEISSQWDDGSSTSYKIWQEGSQWYQLWYDDGDSLGLKYAFTKDSGLAGSGMWALNYDITSEDLWKKIAENFVNDRSGSVEDPVIIDSFPFTHTDDTYRYASDSFDSYKCSGNTYDTSNVNESGPEIIFRFDAPCDGTLTATVNAGQGGSGEREDIDIHILSGGTSEECLIRDDASVSAELEKGTYFASLDSYVGENITKGGPFTVTFEFSSCPDSENQPDDDTKADEDDVKDDESEVEADENDEDGSDDADTHDSTSHDEIPSDDSDQDEDPVSKKSGGCSINEI